jgi:uncharacterized metal-binding protein YceD (DUF177 family)
MTPGIMLRRGKFLLSTLSSQPQFFEADESTDWVKDILVASAPGSEITQLSAEEWASRSTMKVKLEISKMPGDEDYLLRGRFSAVVPTACARCGELVQVSRAGEFTVYLKLVEKTRGNEDLDSGDADLVYLVNPELDVRGFVSEQLILLEPFAEVPERDYQGNPHICAQSLEIQTGQDKEIEAMSPFSKLAQLKLRD